MRGRRKKAKEEWPETSEEAKTRNVRHIKEEGKEYKDKDEVAGQGDVFKDGGAGLDDRNKDEGAGRDDTVKGVGAGWDKRLKDVGAGRSKEDRRIKVGGKRATRWVKVNMGGEELNLYGETGSNITPAIYRQSMGKVVAAKKYLRAWGSSAYLDTKGMFKTTLTTASGARKRTWVYVVAGSRKEPLMGDHDGEELGIISFNPEGRSTRGSEEEGEIFEDDDNVSVPTMLRKAGKEVITERPPPQKVKTKGKEETNWIINGYKRLVFTDRAGRMRIEMVRLKYKDGYKPVQPARYQVPYHYQEKRATHLKKLEAEGVVERVNQEEPVDGILNIASSENKTQGNIRMNIDARQYNKGAKHTRYHVTTPQPGGQVQAQGGQGPQ